MSSMPSAAVARWRPEGNFLRELIVGALRGVAEAIEPLLQRAQRRAIEILADLLDHAAPLERIEQAEHHRLRQPAALRDIPERQRLARRAERRKDPRGVDDRLHEVGIAPHDRP
jgi:hypothetical protein